MAARERPGRLRLRNGGRRGHAAVPRALDRRAAAAARADHLPQPRARGSTHRRRAEVPARRRRAKRLPGGAPRRVAPGGVPARGRAAGLALPAGRHGPREARLPRPSAEHRPCPLPAGGRAGSPAHPGAPPRPLPLARRAGERRFRRAVPAHRDRRPLRDPRRRRPALSQAAAGGRAAFADPRTPHRARAPLPHRGEPRVRARRRPVVAGVRPIRARGRRRGGADRVHRSVGGRGGGLADRGAPGRARTAAGAGGARARALPAKVLLPSWRWRRMRSSSSRSGGVTAPRAASSPGTTGSPTGAATR